MQLLTERSLLQHCKSSSGASSKRNSENLASAMLTVKLLGLVPQRGRSCVEELDGVLAKFLCARFHYTSDLVLKKELCGHHQKCTKAPVKLAAYVGRPT